MFSKKIIEFVSLLIILFTCWNAEAQPQDITWCYAIDSLKNEEVINTIFDEEGNIYVAINYQSRKNGKPHTYNYRRQNYQSLLLKFDTMGQLLWKQDIHSSMDVRTTALAIAPNGDVLITGTGDGRIDFSGRVVDIAIHRSSVYYGGIFLARLNKEGDYQWVQSWESELWATTLTIAVSQKNEIYLGFLHRGNLKNKDQIFEKYIEQPNPFRQLVLAKLSENGVKLESHVLSEDRSGAPDLLTIQFDKQNNLMLYGHYQENLSLLNVEPIHHTNRVLGLNSFMAKYDQNDSLLWMINIGGIWDQVISDITIAPDGSIYLAGIYKRECILSDRKITYSNSIYDESSPIDFGINFFFCHLLSDGTIDFVKYKYHTTTSPFLFRTEALAVDEQGNIHQVGTYKGNVEIEGKQLSSSWYQQQPFYAIWQDQQLVALSELSDAPFGQFTADNFSISNQHFVGSARYTDKDTYININGQKVNLPAPNGWPVSFIYGGSFPRNNSSVVMAEVDSSKTNLSVEQNFNKDILNVRSSANDSLNQDSTKNSLTDIDITLFPSPTSDQVHLKFHRKLERMRLGMYSNLGQLLFTQQLNHMEEGNTLTFNVSELPAGIYYFRLNSEGEQKVFSFVKE